MNKDYSEQEKTGKSVRHLLKKNHKCAILRPTGFGKTFLLTDLIHDYKKVLYVYPLAVIRDTVVARYATLYADEFDFTDEEFDDFVDQETIDTFKAMEKMTNCTLITYAKLIRLSDEELEDMDYDLFVFDECHKMGAPHARIACEKLFAMHDDKYFVGATATPTRADNIDVIALFFSDIMPYTYTLFDAIESGMLKKPTYCYCTYDVEEDLKEAALTAGQDLSDETVTSVLRAKAIEIKKILNIPDIIQDVCENYAKSTSYMKFIAFFASKKHMTESLPTVQGWMKEAYPKHKQNVLCISSRNHEEANNVSKLNSLKPKDKTIDIIACIDMLNLAYHIDGLTGILMCRCTKSNTIFVQQLGRALSAGTQNSAIVFDIVDNLHRKAVYELKQRIADKKRAYNPIPRDTKYSIAKDGKTVVYKVGRKFIPTQYHINDDYEIVDSHGNHAPLEYLSNGTIVYASNVSEKTSCNITEECLNATGHIATYKELLAKAVAEPMVQRCKFAIELHFRTWCHNHNVPYPISKKKLNQMYGLDKDEFLAEFCNIIKANNLDYPLQDANKLVALGTKNSHDVPLKICAEARQVSMDTLLSIMFDSYDKKPKGRKRS